MDKNTKKSNENKKKRGRTVLRKVRDQKSQGCKLNVEWDSVGQSDGKNATKLSSFIGVVARTRCKLTEKWEDVDEQKKDSIWIEISDTFDLPEDKKSKILSRVAESAKKFRGRMTKKVVNAQGQVNPHPPKEYDFIKLKEWEEFCKSRLKEDFLEISAKNRASALKQDCPYRGGRSNYGTFRKKKDGAKTPRYQLWLDARVGKKGDMSERVKEIKEKIEAMEKDPNVNKVGQNDILSRVLPNPEHPGRVRGVGQGVTKRKYFGAISKPKKQDLRDIEVQAIRNRCDAYHAIFMQLKEQGFDITLPEFPPLPEDEVKGDLSKGSIRPDDGMEGGLPREQSSSRDVMEADMNDKSSSSYIDFAEGGSKEKYALHSHESGNRLVAIGNVIMHGVQELVTIHGKPLPSGYLKVSIVSAEEHGALLPMPTDDADNVGEAIGSIVAWPRHLIKRFFEEKLNRRDANPLKGRDTKETSHHSKDVTGADMNDKSSSSYIDFAEGGSNEKYALHSHESGNRLVAIGNVIMHGVQELATIHGKPLPSGYLRVSIVSAEEHEALLPMPTDDADNVGEAIGSIVAWPRHLIKKFFEEKLNRKDANPLKGRDMKETPHHLMPKKINQVKRLEECSKSSSVDLDGLRGWMLQEWIGISEITLYCQYLYERGQKEGIGNKFGFLCPTRLSEHASKPIEVQNYIRDQIKNAPKDKIFLGPFNKSAHWMLVVLHPYSNTVYWLDSLHQEPVDYIKDRVNIPMRQFRDLHNSRVAKATTWSRVQCALQPNTNDCGYYVCRFMDEIVSGLKSKSVDKCCRLQGGQFGYSTSEIDDIRDKLVDFMKKFIQVDDL